MKASRKWGRDGVSLLLPALVSVVHTWDVPQPKCCYVGKTQVAQGDVQGVEQGPPSLR